MKAAVCALRNPAAFLFHIARYARWVSGNSGCVDCTIDLWYDKKVMSVDFGLQYAVK